MRLSTILFLLIATAVTTRAQTFQDFLNRIAGSPDSVHTALVDSLMNAVPSFPFIEQDTLCHFLYRGTATSATVPGDMNNWSTSASPMTRVANTSLFYHSRAFEMDARLDYKFLLNGSTWILDPRNPLTVSGGFGPNSELRMPGYVPAPEILYYANIPHGTLRDTSFFSTNLGNSRTVRVYLPPGYETSTDSFPVVLFHDGLEYVTLANAHNVLDYLIAEGRIHPTIGVFVPPINRTPEYAGAQMSQFTSFIVNELMPYIDVRYRTMRNPAMRAVVGASNGGNISLWIGYNHPEVFGNIGAQSSNIVLSISSGFQSSPTLPLKLYLDLGTYDIPQLIPLVRTFIPILQSKGYVYRYEEYHEGHSWGNWRAHIDNALELFFPGPALGVDDREYIPAEMRLHQNYPNPFNSTTSLTFRLPLDATHPAGASLRVYDVLGREITTLMDGVRTPGIYKVEWDAAAASSGFYLARLTLPGREPLTVKMLLIK
jgi:enterochelin esterase-like enzyme